ncbi:MAG: glycerate kinase type-2 family protein [Thermoanaerobaculia bacterium]
MIRLYRAALEGSDPERAVARALRKPRVAKVLREARRVGLFAVGKAAAGMACGVPERWRRETLVVLPASYPAPELPSAQILFASHPEPGRSSLHAAKSALRFFSGFDREDVLLCLVSGGTSSLLALPRPGWTLGEKRRAIRRLMRSGASIVEVNRLRRSLSAIKGGKLGRSTSARLVTLAVSDVPGDDPMLIGSGPTVRGRRGDVTLVVASNASGLAAAAREVRRLGLVPVQRRRRLSGEARESGRLFARAAAKLSRGEILLAGGETTVALPKRHGHGGRNLEFALGAALGLEGSPGLAMLAAGSDGIDGSSRAAGAFADGSTIARARRFRLDPSLALLRHETEGFFLRLSDVFVTGPTGNNVADWAFALCAR